MPDSPRGGDITPGRLATAGISLAIVLAATALGAGIAWCGASGGAVLLGVPVMVACVALIFAFQWLAFVPALLFRTERFFDLAGGFTTMSAVALGMLLAGYLDLRSFLLATLVDLWALRLAAFLFLRVRREGGDGRFDEYKKSAPRFFVVWTLQALWITLTTGAALAAITSMTAAPLGVVDAIGVAVWCFGFGVEVIADRQKRLFRREEKNRGRFITSGLWAWSRHPNYFGEIVLWIGVALIASQALAGWQLITLLSPVFVAMLLVKVTGVPLLEERADKRWADDPAYAAYQARVPVLLPRLPRT